MKLLIIWIFVIMTIPDGFSHYRQNPEVLVLELIPAENWKKDLPRNKQEHIGDHIESIKELYRGGYVVLNLFNPDSNSTLLVVSGLGQVELQEKFLSHKIFSSKVLSFRIQKSKLLMFNKDFLSHKH